MNTRKEWIAFCKKLPGAYEDYPFHDSNWTVMRHRSNRKSFAYLFEKDDQLWINVKCDPEWREFWRNAFPSVVPGFHMNKIYWNSIIIDGTVPDSDIKRMIRESYDLTDNGKKRLSNQKSD